MLEFEAFMLDFAALYAGELTPRSARLSYAALQHK
jgi:hypothetical protein